MYELHFWNMFITLSIPESEQQINVTADLEGPILSKLISLHQIQDFSFIWIFQ